VADVYLEERFPEPGTQEPDEPEAATEGTVDAAALAKPTVEELRACEGRYFSEELEATYVLAVNEGALTLQRGRLGPVRLEPTVRDEYRGDGLRLVFDHSGRRQPPGLTAHAEGVRDIRFERTAE
jgi:hypothetical protein